MMLFKLVSRVETVLSSSFLLGWGEVDTLRLLIYIGGRSFIRREIIGLRGTHGVGRYVETMFREGEVIGAVYG